VKIGSVKASLLRDVNEFVSILVIFIVLVKLGITELHRVLLGRNGFCKNRLRKGCSVRI